MGFKVLCVFILAVVTSGYSAQEIRLPDLEVNYISHSHVGRTISIPKDFRDTLRFCHIIFPNGANFEVFPNYRVTHPNMFFLQSVQPFTSCGVGFRNVGVDFSGTYELLSTVLHSNNTLSLTRRRFIVRVTLMESADGQE